LDGWSGGVRDILNLRLGGRDGDVAGLSVIELLEEVRSDDGVVPNEGVEVVVGRSGGVDGRVRVSGHPSAVENAVGFLAEGGMEVTVLDDGGGPFGLSALCFLLLWERLVGCVEVPRWRG